MDADLAARIDTYIASLFGADDEALTRGLANAAAAGLPPIHISSNQGRLLYLIAKIRGVRRVLEVGTLGGYSTTWLARALPEAGQLITLEINPAHAAVARTNVDRAGIGSRVRIEVGPAADTLGRMMTERAEPFDLVFIDADKPGYATYLDLCIELSHPGTVIIADNLIRGGLVMDAEAQDINARAARAFNETLAAHPRLESTIVPLMRAHVDGMSISIVK